jgi:hypothetical protein
MCFGNWKANLVLQCSGEEFVLRISINQEYEIPRDLSCHFLCELIALVNRHVAMRHFEIFHKSLNIIQNSRHMKCGAKLVLQADPY